jgi:membrane peptidoglycan carboxypeptidase
VWYPSVKIQSINFAKNTPYETLLDRRINGGKRLLSPELTSKVREALIGTVEKGTARSAYQAFIRDDGTLLALGGKTGTGDNHYNVYGPDGNLIKSWVTNRAATFVFIIGDRFFGTITAFVPGTEAEAYKFTSSLPVHVLKILAPKLMPLIDEEGEDITEIKEDVKSLEENQHKGRSYESMVGDGPHCMDSLRGMISSDQSIEKIKRHQAASANG